MKDKKPKIIPLTKENYLRFIKNSVGSKSFQNFYALVGGRKKDLLKNGDLSCAYFVSSVLKIFDLIGRVHLTVSGALADMKKSGWREAAHVKQGCVLVWEAKKSGRETHKHIGFYMDGNKAISNSAKERTPVKHSFTFGGKAELSQSPAERGGKRRIEAVYWHKKLGK